MRWKSSSDLLPVLESLFPPGGSPDDLPEGAALLKDGPVRRVYRLDREGFGGPVLVKRYRPSTFVERLRDLVRRSVAEREWRAARWLASRDVPVAEPLAVGTLNKFGGGSLYVCRFVESAASVHETLVTGKADRALWEALGRFLSDLHRAGGYHPDLHLGNVLARKEGGGWSLVLVDLHAFSLEGFLTTARAERNLAQVRNSFVAGSAKDFLRGLKAYQTKGRPPGVDPAGLAR
ncbi:MAG: lipopolysaccharide kinase InaA family protein, partial [Planctomycetota bacterium]